MNWTAIIDAVINLLVLLGVIPPQKTTAQRKAVRGKVDAFLKELRGQKPPRPAAPRTVHTAKKAVKKRK